MPMRSLSEKSILIALLVVALALRLTSVSGSLWLDEGYSIASARWLHGIDEQRPLYFWLLRGWMKLGGSAEIWIRLPSVIFGVASVALCYALARRFGSSSIALLAAALMTFSTSQIFHSQEVRMYTLLPFLMLCSGYGLARWSERPRWWWLAFHGVAGCLALLAFPLAIPGLGMMWLFCCWSVMKSKRLMLAVVVTALLTLAVWLPFFVPFLGKQDGTTWVPRPGLDQPAALQRWALVLGGWWSLPLPFSILNWSWRFFAAAVTILAVAGALRPRYRAIGAGYFGVVFAIFFVSILAVPIWSFRYFMGVFPALFFLVACGLDAVRGFSAAAFRVLFGAIVCLELLSSALQARAAPLEDWRGAAAAFSKGGGPRDLIVVTAMPLEPNDRGVWGYYYRGSAEEIYWRSERNSPDEWEAKVEELQQGMDRGSKLWIVLRNSPFSAVELDALFARLRQRFAVEKQAFNGVDLLLLTPR
jgi:hypothetical protein